MGKKTKRDAGAAAPEAPHDPAAEYELKLEIDPAHVAALLAAAPFDDADAADRAQRSVYFDTPEHALHAAGFSLRVRTIGDRHVQTVKAEGAAAAGLFVRPEWERDIADGRPLVDGGTPLRGLIADAEIDRIAPVFEVCVTRRAVQVVRPDAHVEFVLDRGELLAGGRSEPIHEIELELKHGTPVALFELARRIDQIATARLGVLTKSESGYRMGVIAPDRPVKTGPLALAAAMTAAAGFQAIVGACLRQFRLNEAILVRTGHPGALHQARVGLRRLRSALSTFKPIVADDRYDPIRADLRWIAGELGRARNLDVLLERVPDGAAAQPLHDARAEAYAAVQAALASPRLRAAMIDLAEWAAIGAWRSDPVRAEARDQPIAAFAAQALERHRRRLKRLGRDLATVSDEDRHAARIEAKKLRYATEFFGALFAGGKRARRHRAFLGALEALQAHLGDLNDLATAPIVLADLALAGSPTAEALRPDPSTRDPLLRQAADARDVLIDCKRFWP